MVFDVRLGRFSGMVCGVMKMPLCRVRVMSCCFVVARFVVDCRFAMMPGSMFVMLGGLAVMFCSLF